MGSCMNSTDSCAVGQRCWLAGRKASSGCEGWVSHRYCFLSVLILRKLNIRQTKPESHLIADALTCIPQANLEAESVSVLRSLQL